MNRTKLFLSCALALVVSFAGTRATAQQPVNQLTYFSFSAPFELPGGKTLPAGKYVFKVLDSPSNRHIVQILSEDQQTMHATLFAIPAQRPEPADEPEVRFMEAAADAAPAIRTWWYPGRSIGHEFIYPKDQARRLAARERDGVLTVAGESTGDEAMKTGALARVDAGGQEAAVTAEAAVETTNDRVATAATEDTTNAAPSGAGSTPDVSSQARTAEPPRAASARTDGTAERERTELPRTASLLPLVGLLGLGSLIGAVVLRRSRR
jgi:hypothetical protein